MALLSNINGKFVVEQTTGYVGVGTTDPSYPIEVLNASAEIALNASGGSIYRVQSDNASNFIIRKEGVGDRLVINSTGNATFSGMITVNGGGIDIDNNDDVRLRFDNASVFKAGLQVATTAGDMIAGSAVNDFAIRSQENMLFATGGNTERMRIDSSGALLVGGTASPSTSWKGTAVFGQQGTNKVIIGYLSAFSENVVGGHNSALDAWDSLTLAGTDFKFRTGSGATDTSMVIDSSGNVGIGTTSPDLTGFGWNVLSIVGGTTAGSAGVLELGSPTTNANAQNLGIIAFMDGSTRNAQIDVARATSTSTANMSFYTNGGSGIVERMRIDSAGKVSVGSPVVGQLGVRGTTNDSTAYSFESANLSGNTLFAVRNDGLSFFPSGNVGIGLTSPASKLDINGGRIGIRNNIVAASNLTYSTIYSTENSGAAYPFTGTSGNLVVEPRNGQDFVVLGTSGVARMVVKGGGNVGIGTNSPTSYNLNADNLVIYETGDFSGITLAADNDQGSNIYFADPDDNNVGGITYNHTNNYMNFRANGAERMRIDSSGNVGIGVTPNAPAGNIQLDVGDNGCGMTSRQNNELVLQANANYSTYAQAGVPATRLNLTNSGEFHFLNAPAGAAVGDTISFTERMRITSGGEVLIRRADYTDTTFSLQVGDLASDSYRPIRCTVASTAARTQIAFYNPSGLVGTISTNGSATAYNTSSDYRLKENVVSMTGALDRVGQLKPSRFNFIADADTTVDGFLAHEVSSVVPEAISGEKDAMRTEDYEVTPAVLDEDGNVITEAVMGTRVVPDYQGIDQSKLVPLLVKTIQELEARITTLEANNP